MRLKRFSLIIVLLFSVCAVYAQGTEVDVIIQNSCPSTCGYHIDITLHQPDAQPYTGSLSYNISASSTNTMHLEFDDVDICIDEITCTYLDTDTSCTTSTTLDVKCYDALYPSDAIAPYNDQTRKCYTFDYYSFNNPNSCKYLYYYFAIY